MKTKICRKCQTEKPLADFYNSDYYKKRNKDSDYYCKFCRVGTAIKSQQNNAKRCSIENCNKPHYARDWCRVHYSRWLRTGKTQRKFIPAKQEYAYGGRQHLVRREYLLLSQYKMSLSEFESRTINGCEMCGDKPEVNLEVDHDHSCCSGALTCGKCVRGIICPRCNVTVQKYENGVMREDNPNRDKVIKYLEVYNAKKG